MPFEDFHAAIEKALGRSVWTHEFAFADSLMAEFLGERPAPSMQDILDLIPPEKRILIQHVRPSRPRERVEEKHRYTDLIQDCFHYEVSFCDGPLRYQGQKPGRALNRPSCGGNQRQLGTVLMTSPWVSEESDDLHERWPRWITIPLACLIGAGMSVGTVWFISCAIERGMEWASR